MIAAPALQDPAYGEANMYHTTMMKRASLPLLIMLIAAVGCKDDSVGTVDETAALVGVWDAKRWEVADAADPGNSFDFILLGFSFTLELTADGRFVATVGLAGESMEAMHGRVTVNGDRLILDPDVPDEDSMEYRYALAGSSLTLTRTTPQDTDGDGVEETVRETLVFQRR